MSRDRRITYMIEPDMGMVYSRVGSEVAIPVLDFAWMTSENGYETNYPLEKFNVLSVAHDLQHVKHTRKIPVEIKNEHRKFWGMKPLKYILTNSQNNDTLF